MKCRYDNHEVPEDRMFSGYCNVVHGYMNCNKCMYHENNGGK